MEQRTTPHNDHKENSWLMTQDWENVLFLHWPVSKEELRKHVPDELELDLYDDSAWISLVLFTVGESRPRLMPPISPAGNFPEINVRTYVKHGKKPGIYFFTLDANSDFVVSITTLGDFLPYKKAEIDYIEENGRFAFSSRRTEENEAPDSFTIGFKPLLDKMKEKQDLDRFLTDRFTFWRKPKNTLYRMDITHPEWDLYPVEFQIQHNTMASFIDFPQDEKYPLVHYSPFMKTKYFPPIPVELGGEKLKD
ncbi:YqjF family protein [Lysinibacillus sp. 3P01SB]|uniref:YqjF family protein n=1 Tax=Lysinibacillus sp. 3P01SB TaxID=3132284 RepID=UPI0039A6D9D1